MDPSKLFIAHRIPRMCSLEWTYRTHSFPSLTKTGNGTTIGMEEAAAKQLLPHSSCSWALASLDNEAGLFFSFTFLSLGIGRAQPGECYRAGNCTTLG